MGDSRTIALVAKPTSRIPFVTSEWREHFKMLGCTRGESPCRDSCFVNKQVCILKLFLEKNSIFILEDIDNFLIFFFFFFFL